MNFKEHQVEWTDEKVSRFWNFFGRQESSEDFYFSKQLGNEVINFALKKFKLQGNILDYGSGRGFLIDYLIKQGFGKIWGCDFSIDSVNEVNKKFNNVKDFFGCIKIDNLPSQLNTEAFDTIFLLEIIEHLSDTHLKSTILELNRVLKEGGHLILTTRNNENLEKSKIICPDCGAIFHRVQHVKSFDKKAVVNEMEKYGFEEVFCDAVKLVDYREGLLFFIKRYLKKMLKKKKQYPNLIYIGKKISTRQVKT